MAELSLVVKATAVLLLALAAVRCAGRLSAAVRSWILSCAFGLLALLPAASIALPVRAIEIPAEYAAPFMPAPVQADAAVPRAAVVDAIAPVPSRRPAWLSVRAAALVAWAVGAVGFAVPLVVGLIRLRRLRHRGRRWMHASLPSSVQVLLHDAVPAPMTYGVRPVVVLPPDAPQWSRGDLRRVMLHELEHVRRRDWLVQMAARAICALYWFHPLVWIAWRRLGLECERACDDVVVREEDGAAYAVQLLSLARRIKSDPLPLLSMASRSTLSTRIGAVLASNVARGRLRIAVAGAVAAVAAMAALGVGPLQAVSAGQRPTVESSGPAFESAAVSRTVVPLTAPQVTCCHVRYSEDGRMSGSNVDLVDLIVSAYGLYRWQVADAPQWAGGGAVLAPATGADRFDVQGLAGRRAGSDDMRQMLRTLLADRFGLAVHTETRVQKVYELVVEPSGHKLQPPGDRAYVAQEDIWLRVEPETMDATLQVDRMTMAELARNLGGILQTVVSDRTGLSGPYRVAARWDAYPVDRPLGPTIFESFPAQLGLRFRETTSPVEYLVVDRAGRPALDDQQ